MSADSVKQKSSVHFIFNAKSVQPDMDKIQIKTCALVPSPAVPSLAQKIFESTDFSKDWCTVMHLVLKCFELNE